MKPAPGAGWGGGWGLSSKSNDTPSQGRTVLSVLIPSMHSFYAILHVLTVVSKMRAIPAFVIVILLYTGFPWLTVYVLRCWAIHSQMARIIYLYSIIYSESCTYFTINNPIQKDYYCEKAL